MRKFITAAFAIAASLVFAATTANAQTARIDTDLGTITVALDAAHAPKTVANFIAYAREGHFDGTVVYRVVRGFVIQMGSYEADGHARPTHAPIGLETANGLKNVRGTLAMARGDDPVSADAEFFINLSDNTEALDPKPDGAPNATGYTVFGEVTDGMDVVDKIAASVLGGKGPFPAAAPSFPVTIKKITIVTP
jgi:peptidyl-prolyl cis-trans isomerase A (cyclophilin A)/peptidyl-prolyl cis-trans isomerase B (cyclophilin B)